MHHCVVKPERRVNLELWYLHKTLELDMVKPEKTGLCSGHTFVLLI